jgi:PAS domain S-box-containing protein
MTEPLLGQGINFTSLFAGIFIPHGHCYLWKPDLVLLHVLSDSLIALAYYSIPITLFYFVRKRQDLPFDWIFLLFGAFIIACGTTHIMEVWTLWHPNYWLSGWIKAITAIASMYTALELVPLVPLALALPSPAQLEAANQELKQQIRDRVLVEEALRQSEERYRAIVEDQTELIARLQPDGTLSFMNEAYCRYFGQSRQELIGNSYEPFIFEEDREQIEQMLNSLNSKKPVATIEHRVIVRGEVRWMQWSNRMIFDEQDRFVELQSVGRDITDRKQVEFALQESQHFIQKIADTTPVFLYVHDLKAERNVYTNREVTSLLGYTPEEIQAMGAALLPTILHPDDFAQLPQRNKRWEFVKDGDILQSEYWMRHANGEWRYFQCQETVFTRNHGLPRQILGAAVDITLAKHLEEVRRAEERLQASLKEKEVLLKEIHHRVKNNLQLIYSLLRLQGRRVRDIQAAEILIDSQNRVKSIALIHEKLYQAEDLSKIDFAQYISNLAGTLFSSYKISSDAITLKTKVDVTALDINKAIPCGLIVNELISNSLKYAFPLNCEGQIQVELYTNSDRQMTLIVRDNGIGIPEHFDFTATESLGLQLVKDFVNQLGGNIQLDRSQGTEFRITFPGGKA